MTQAPTWSIPRVSGQIDIVWTDKFGSEQGMSKRGMFKTDLSSSKAPGAGGGDGPEQTMRVLGAVPGNLGFIRRAKRSACRV